MQITECKCTRGLGTFDIPQVMVKYADSDDFELLFTYYPDEISFSPQEFVGLTKEEAIHLKFEKDRAYLYDRPGDDDHEQIEVDELIQRIEKEVGDDSEQTTGD